ncbi:MAG TPA: NADPH-dependent F420 reductase [Rhizomicrobium sp.]|nr:NADPH-dependent F420 reductase [Rhizomicrobium sp.]
MNERVAVLGGTGPQGSGLALRWAKGGLEVVIGGREAARSARTAERLTEKLQGQGRLSGADNRTAVDGAEIVVLCVPYAAQTETIGQVRDLLNGKILVDVTVPLKPPRVGTVQLPQAGSAAVELQRFLGGQVRLVSAFQNVSAQHLLDLEHDVDCDVLISGDDNDACEAVVRLAKIAGLNAWRAGPLANAAAAEALTSVLIAINRRYKIAGAGIRITGTPMQSG